MRKAFCNEILKRVDLSSVVLFTGDLGYGAFESLRDRMGERFINAGVAEQNMVSMAAAFTKLGYEAWVYSIAPFVFARPFEQLRNDVSFQGLPVKLVGNGGGYPYGVMGPSHHALEDYGVLLTLPGFKIFLPSFDEDLEEVVPAAAACPSPTYLRLGISYKPTEYKLPPYGQWRQLLVGDGPVLLTAGSLTGIYLREFMGEPQDSRPNLWAVSELPFTAKDLPINLLEQVNRSRRLIIAEEHVAQGGIASQICTQLLAIGVGMISVTCFQAASKINKRYGSHQFMLEQDGLIGEVITAVRASSM